MRASATVRRLDYVDYVRSARDLPFDVVVFKKTQTIKKKPGVKRAINKKPTTKEFTKKILGRELTRF